MWTYANTNRYITFEHLRLIMRWFEEVDTKTNLSSMLTNIKRYGAEYSFHILNTSGGYERKFCIKEQQIIDLGIHNL